MSQAPVSRGSTDPVAGALRDCRRAFVGVALFSAMFNLMMLAGPLYMLQVYDRVLASRSIPTLVALSLFLVAALVFQGAMDIFRSKLVVRTGLLFDSRLSRLVHRRVLDLSRTAPHPGMAGQPVRDLDQVRSFLNGSGTVAILDLPWAPVFLVLCFVIHPLIGVVSVAGALVLIVVTVLTELNSRDAMKHAAVNAERRAGILDANRRGSESAAALGMSSVLTDRWDQANGRYQSGLGRSSDLIGAYGSISKIARMGLQSAILGFGAYLVIQRELSPGAMIASSIMMGRGLAPIETSIANWRGLVAARQALARLKTELRSLGDMGARLPLPAPRRQLDVEDVTVGPPNGPPVLTRVHFSVLAGEAVGIIGPSGAGKTSLVRTLVGIWPAMRGVVRLDGSSILHWDPDQLGPSIGYVSQSVELFDGAIAENIARMQPDPNPGEVLAAAHAAGAHEVIARLPGGYATQIGDAGAALSAGQRQRIALARALFGNPFLVVLDEPNSNLDSEGEAALHAAIAALKERGAIVLIVAHRPASLAQCDKVLLLGNGQQLAFGPRDAVLRNLSGVGSAPAPVQAPASPFKVVSDGSGGDR